MENGGLYNESDVLSRVAKDDQSAFSQIVAQYGTLIHTHLSIYIKDVMNAEEITQDILMGIWRNRERLPAMQNFPGYVYIITRNRIKKHFKEKLAIMTELPEDALFNLVKVSGSNVEQKQLVEILHRGIDLLPPKRKIVFQLSRYDGLTHEEIAGRLSISKNTIKQHIKEALVFLRNYIYQMTGEILLLMVWIYFA